MTTRGRMMERLQVILAGRAAEEVAFDMPSSYSINDLRVLPLLAMTHASMTSGYPTLPPPPLQ